MDSLPRHFYYKKNRIQQLKGFYYTAKLGSPSKAAKYMCLGQSTVTMQIQSLERDLNAILFVKSRGNFELTRDGHLLYKIAVPLIQGIDGLYEQFVLQKKHAETSEISIAAHHIAISYLLPKYLKPFMETFPRVKVNILNIPRTDAIKRLINNKIDFMIYPTDAIPEECLFKPSFSYDPILIMHKSHPLANKNTITLKDMSRHDLVRIDPQLITLPFFEEAVEKYGIGSNISFENGNWEMLKHFVRAKIGMAMVSTICIDESDTDIVTKSMKKFFPTMVYGIMVKKGHYLNETVKDLITFLDDEFLENNEIQNP